MRQILKPIDSNRHSLQRKQHYQENVCQKMSSDHDDNCHYSLSCPIEKENIQCWNSLQNGISNDFNSLKNKSLNSKSNDMIQCSKGKLICPKSSNALTSTMFQLFHHLISDLMQGHHFIFNYKPKVMSEISSTSFVSCSNKIKARRQTLSLSTERTKSTLTIIGIYMSIVLICIVCYWNSLTGDFVHDDIPAIVQNPDVLGTTTIHQLFMNDFWGRPMSDPQSHKSYRPITTLTFRLNMMISIHPFGFHLVNLLLHIAVSILVCCLTKNIFNFDCLQCWLSGALFATHPIHCEAVSSIVGRADVLCALFYLCAFLIFHNSLFCNCLMKQIALLVLFVLMTTMALLSKEIGITVLAMCAFHWWWSSFGKWSTLSTIKRTTVLAPILTILSSFFILMTFRIQMLGETWPFFSDQDNPASHSKSILTRTLTYLYLTVFNVGLLLSPKHQAYDWQTSSIRLIESIMDHRNIQTICLLVSLILLLYRAMFGSFIDHTKQQQKWKNNLAPNIGKQLSLSLLLLVMPYLPASNLFITVGFVVAERLLYIPSIGFICLICIGLKILQNQHLEQQKLNIIHRNVYNLSRLSLFTLIMVFALKTIQQNRVWHSRESLYKSGIVNVPENAKAHYNYGNLQQDIGNWNDAMYHYQTAIRLWPEHASAHNNLGALFWKLSKTDHAEKHFTKALKINPYHAKAHFNLGKVYSKRGQTLEAIFLMEQSIRLDGRFGESYEALAALYAHIGKLTLAERFYLRAIRLRPRNADFYNNYGAFLQKTGRFEYARRHYQRALDLKPEHQIALVNMANLLTIMNRFDQAEYFYKRAMKLKKDLATLDSLGTLYLRRSKLNMARHVYQDELWNEYYSNRATSSSDLIGTSRQTEIPSNEHPMLMLPTSSANIHYAQLLILEGRFSEAEVLLEALTLARFSKKQPNNSNNDDDDDDELIENSSTNHQRSYSSSLMDSIQTKNNDSRKLLISWLKSIDNGPLSSKSSSTSSSRESSSFQIDVYHQLALLYTLTNRTTEALDSIMKALKICELSIDGHHRSLEQTHLTGRCSQIYTLQGDIQKDHHQWPNAIQSYKKALELDECLSRAHLHLAVIYHLGEEYAKAMHHYTMAQQLDNSSNRKLINENMSKLRFRIQRLDYQPMANMKTIDNQLGRYCKSRYLVGPYGNQHQFVGNRHHQIDQSEQNLLLSDSLLMTAMNGNGQINQPSNSNVLSLSSSILSSY